MAESQRVNITVPESMYDEWRNAVEQEGVASSISELVRVSVNRNLDGNLRGTQSPQVSGEATLSDEALGYLQSIDSAISEVEKRIERLEEESRSSSKSGGVDLQKVVHKVLPEVPLPAHLARKDGGLEEVDMMGEIENHGIPSTEDVTRQIDGEYTEVLDALIKLEPRDPAVVSYESNDGTIYWWRDT